MDGGGIRNFGSVIQHPDKYLIHFVLKKYVNEISVIFVWKYI